MKKIYLPLIFTILGILPSVAAFDVFMRFERSAGSKAFDGDSQDSEYNRSQGWFEVTEYSLGIVTTVNIGSTTGGGGAGKATFDKVIFTKKAGAGSANFFQSCATGQHYEKVILVVRKQGSTGPGTSSLRVLQAELHFVMVESVRSAGSDGDDVVSEVVTLQHGAHKIEFFGLGGANGTSEVLLGTTTWSRILNNATTGT